MGFIKDAIYPHEDYFLSRLESGSDHFTGEDGVTYEIKSAWPDELEQLQPPYALVSRDIIYVIDKIYADAPPYALVTVLPNPDIPGEHQIWAKIPVASGVKIIKHIITSDTDSEDYEGALYLNIDIYAIRQFIATEDPVPTQPEFIDWKHVFCPNDPESCTIGEVAKEAVGKRNEDYINNRRYIESYLVSNGYTLNDDDKTVTDTEGRVKNTQAVLEKLMFDTGYSGVVRKCLDNKVIYIDKESNAVRIHGHCPEIYENIKDYWEINGCSYAGNVQRLEGEFTCDGKVIRPKAMIERMDRRENGEHVREFQRLMEAVRLAPIDISEFLEAFHGALERREANTDLPPEVDQFHGDMVPLVNKWHKNHWLYFTNDPVEVATKSTGRPWAFTSCERWRGQFQMGFIDDVVQHNYVVFVLDPHGQPIGRTMVRWGKDCQSGEICWGTEPTFYTKEDMESSFEDAVTAAIRLHIENKGGEAGCCQTPYIYKGYSDKIRAGNQKIVYTDIPSDVYIKYKDGYLWFDLKKYPHNPHIYSQRVVNKKIAFDWAFMRLNFDEVTKQDALAQVVEDIRVTTDPERSFTAEEESRLVEFERAIHQYGDQDIIPPVARLANEVGEYVRSRPENTTLGYIGSSDIIWFDSNTGTFFGEEDTFYQYLAFEYIKTISAGLTPEDLT